MKKGPNGRKIKTERWGQGQRWQLRRDDGPDESFHSKDAAEARLTEVRSGVNRNSYTTLTVAEYAEDWLSQQLHYKRNSSLTAATRIRSKIIPALGDLPLAGVTRLDVQRAVSAWAEEMKPNSVRLVMSYVRGIFQTAAQDHLIDATPCIRINVPARVRNRVVPMAPEQIKAISAKVAERYRAMVVIGAATGLRIAELKGVSESRLIGGDVVIDRQVDDVLTGGAPVWGPPKSAASDRRIALGRVASAALDRHMELYPPGVDGLLFTTREHGAIRPSRAAAIWRAAAEGMNLRPRSGWHDLRHYHASVLIHAGRSPKSVAARLGHVDAAETLRTYAHLWPSDEEGLVAVVDADMELILGPSVDRPGSADRAA